jgi:hypothetical protein
MLNYNLKFTLEASYCSYAWTLQLDTHIPHKLVSLYLFKRFTWVILKINYNMFKLFAFRPHNYECVQYKTTRVACATHTQSAKVLKSHFHPSLKAKKCKFTHSSKFHVIIRDITTQQHEQKMYTIELTCH